MSLRAAAEGKTPQGGGRLPSPQHDSCNETLTDVTSQGTSSGLEETGSSMSGWNRTGSPPLRAHNVTKSLQPQPPPSDGRAGPLSGRRYLRHSTDRTRRLNRRAVTSSEDVPFSQEETAKPSLSPISSPRGPLPPVELSPGEVVTLLPLSTGSSTDVDVERRMRDGVLSGLEYFEKRNKELREIKDRLVRELNRVTQINRELEENINTFMKKINVTNDESDELKYKLDRMEKENIRLQEQAAEEWRSRKKAEELYVQFRASSAEISKSLKEDLEHKDTELKNLKKKLELYSKNNSIGIKEDKEVYAELHSRIESLLKDNKLVVSENDLLKNQSNKLKVEVENLKTQVGEKNSELERQFSRFLTLKKSFNDIREENERLKNRTSAPANITWPRDAGRVLPPTSGTSAAHAAGSTSVSSLNSTTTCRSTQPQCRLPPAQPYGGRRRGVPEGKGMPESRGMPESSLPPVPFR